MAVAPDARASASPERARAASLVLAISPVLAVLAGLLTGYLDPMLANPPGVLGLPLGVVLLAVAAFLTGLAVVAALRGRRPGSIIAFVAPALALVVLGPVLTEALVQLG